MRARDRGYRHGCLCVLLAGAALVLPAMALGQAGATSTITYGQKVSHCEGKWFAAQSKDGGNVLGFAYIDPEKGFTFEHYGRLEESDGKFVAVASELKGKARVIERVDRDFPAWCLDQALVSDLGLQDPPDTMTFYRDDRPEGEHHASWAYHLNHIGASDSALQHVQKAIKTGFSSPGLTFEHAYALNALGRFDEVVTLLTPVADQPDCPADTIAELAFAHLSMGRSSKAIEIYEKALEAKAPSERRWEFASNIAFAYKQLANQAKSDEWLRRAQEYKAQTAAPPARW